MGRAEPGAGRGWEKRQTTCDGSRLAPSRTLQRTLLSLPPSGFHKLLYEGDRGERLPGGFI